MLNEYEKTIIEHVIAFGANGTFTPRKEDMVFLANQLKLSEDVLGKALTLNEELFNKGKIEFEGEEFCPDFYNSPLIGIVFSYYYIIKNLMKIDDDTSKEALRNNINCFKDALTDFEIMNAFLDTAEAQRQNKYTYEFLIFNGDYFILKSSLDALTSYAAILNCDILPELYVSRVRLLQIILKYDLLTCANTLYLVAIAQLLSHSRFFSEEVKSIAQDFYLNLTTLLKNSRVISVRANYQYQDISKPFSKRNRNTDNTTRLEIVYGFENYDAYTMRLDLAHIGQGFTHYNNSSRGGVKCCLFSYEEYCDVIKKYPEIRACFIQYGNKYALKERGNCNFDVIDKELYESVREAKEHDKAFKKAYSEKSIVEFINYVGQMLPYTRFAKIDKDGVYSEHCYQYNAFMMDVTNLFECVCLYGRKAEDTLIKLMVDRAINIHLIPPEDYELYLSVDGICDLAKQYKERIE